MWPVLAVPRARPRRLINYYRFLCVALFLFQDSLIHPRWMSGAVLKTEEAVRQAKACGLVPFLQKVSRYMSSAVACGFDEIKRWLCG